MQTLVVTFLLVFATLPQALAVTVPFGLARSVQNNLLSKKFLQQRLLPVLVIYKGAQWVQVKRRQAIDPTSEWARYARQPGARGRDLMCLLCLQVFPLLLLSKILPVHKKHRAAVEAKAGEVLADGLLKLGPLYVKLGQIVSSREDLLPASWVLPMSRLQDQVPARTGKRALELAEAAWSASSSRTPGGNAHQQRAFHEVFADFDTTPLAAASLGQVHRAVLRDTNEPVAIKLQRPHLREIYTQDLAFLRKIATAVDSFLSRRKKKGAGVGGVSQSWTQIFNDAEQILFREIDYNAEADNGIRFNEDFGLGKDGSPVKPRIRAQDGSKLPSAAPWLRAPYVYRELSSEQVLVMEYVPSIKITNLETLDAAGVTPEDRVYLADCLGRAYLRQFCSNLFFSTDPHPGNLGVEILDLKAKRPQDRVRLVFYDFGQAATLKSNQADGILQIVEAIVDLDVDRSVRSFQTMGVLKADADLEQVRAKVADNFRTGKVKANRKRLERQQYRRDADVALAPKRSMANLRGGQHSQTSRRLFRFRRASSRDGTDTVMATPTTSNHSVLSSSVSSLSSSGSIVPEDSRNVVVVNDADVLSAFTLPAEYAFVGRALSQMDGVGKSLDPEFDFISAAAPWIYEIKGASTYVRQRAGRKFRKLRMWFSSSEHSSV